MDHKLFTESMVLNAAKSLLAEVGETFTLDQLEAETSVSKAKSFRRVFLGGEATLKN